MHERRVEIADAVLRLAGTRGIAALTMGSLAAEVGVTPGALFRHFATRDEMLAAAAHRAEALLAASFPPADLPPLARLERLVLARMAAIEAHPGLVGLMLSDQFLLALPPPAAATLRAVVQQTRGFVTAALRDGADAGVVRRDLPPEDLALVVLGTIQLAAARGAGALAAAGARGAAARQRLWDTLAALLAPHEKGAAAARAAPAKERHGARARRPRR